MEFESEFMRQPRNISFVLDRKRKCAFGSGEYCQGMSGVLGACVGLCGASVCASVGKVRKQKQTECEV